MAQRSAELARTTQVLETEIGERERAERELVHSEAHYLSLIENLPVHVIRKDAAGRFTFASQSFCELLGAIPSIRYWERPTSTFTRSSWPKSIARTICEWCATARS